MMTSIPAPETLRQYFSTGATRSLAFRKERLKNLRDSLLKHEGTLNEALEQDLKKSKEEIWLTETGLVLAEIAYFLKHIDGLAAPQKVPTNLFNLPGKSYIHSEPLGVVLIVAPWNYPLQLGFVPLVGAIAAGNCVVLKPSEVATATEQVMRQIITETFEPRYVCLATGDGATVVPEIMGRFRFDHIFFTGSTTVGRQIYQLAATQLTPVTLELGGKNPCIVSANANLKLAAKRILLAKCSNAGQMCIAPDYLLVHQSVKGELVALLEQTIQDFYGVHPVESYDFGRIINQQHFDRLMGYLKTNTVIAGGTHNEAIRYIAPTLIDEPGPADPIMQEEIFGPLLPILSYADDEAALAVIRNHPDPLAFYVFSNDRSEADRWVERVPSGGACINAVALHYLNRNLPFGGRGSSGMGHYHGHFSFATFSHQKAVLKAAVWPDLPLSYPSFKGKLSIIKKLLR